MAQYTGLNFLQIQDLDYEDYLLLRRDAVISKLKESDEGREYLDKAWRLEQTTPDRKALRSKFGKEG